MSVTPYLIPQFPVVFEETIKKSRFLTYLSPTDGVKSAKTYIQSIRLLHPQANHHCTAFIGGRPTDSNLWGFSDDGEPSGTAGKPMLAQLSGSDLGEITAVVVRYFGGIHLGTGGLVKAYGGGVQQALPFLSVVEKRSWATLLCQCEYDDLAVLEWAIPCFEAQVIERDYTEMVIVCLQVDARQVDVFKDAVTQRSQGRIQFLTS